MAKVTVVRPYQDKDGNEVVGSLPQSAAISVEFRGKNNRLTVDPGSTLTRLTVVFHGDHGSVTVGHNATVGKPKLSLRIGHRGAVHLGNNVSTTTPLFASAAEGATISVGDDVMFATHVQLRTDDSHAIYDVASGNRVNPSQDITIGDHVWVGYESVVLGGVSIGSSSVVGLRSIVTGDIPANCVAAGVPARVVKQGITWERPYLWLSAGPVDAASAGIDTTQPHWHPAEP